MTPATDPYRTLGLERGASLAEVKRAYRALAKTNHPDAAGPSALPRFLAIQAAYERLTGGPAAKSSTARDTAGPPRPSETDPDRADDTSLESYARILRHTMSQAHAFVERVDVVLPCRGFPRIGQLAQLLGM